MAPGVRSKFDALRFKPEAFRKQMYPLEKTTYDILGTFWHPSAVIWHPRSNLAPEELCPLCHTPDWRSHYHGKMQVFDFFIPENRCDFCFALLVLQIIFWRLYFLDFFLHHAINVKMCIYALQSCTFQIWIITFLFEKKFVKYRLTLFLWFSALRWKDSLKILNVFVVWHMALYGM